MRTDLEREHGPSYVYAETATFCDVFEPVRHQVFCKPRRVGGVLQGKRAGGEDGKALEPCADSVGRGWRLKDVHSVLEV
jgi:hypothetical protein